MTSDALTHHGSSVRMRGMRNSHPAVGRLLWKEWRTIRGFWLAGLVLGMVLDLVLSQTVTQVTVVTYYGVAFLVTVFFAIGAAATRFAMEHEEGTHSFLQLHAAPISVVIAAKLSMVVLATVSVFLALALFGRFVPFQSPGVAVHSPLGVVSLALVALEAIVYGTLLSLLIRRPLVAAVATIALLSLLYGGIPVLADALFPSSLMSEDYGSTWWIRLVLLGLAAVSCGGLARTWLLPPCVEDSWPVETDKCMSLVRRGGAALAAIERSAVRQWSTVGRLVWQAWGQSWRTMLPMSLAAISAGLIALLTLVAPTLRGLNDLPAITLLLCTVTSAVYASGTFGGDWHRRQITFLTQRGARPLPVWLSRVAVWSAAWFPYAIVILGMVSLAVLLKFRKELGGIDQTLGDWQSRPWILTALLTHLAQLSRVCAMIALGFLVGFLVGQFVSLHCRSGLVAGFLAALVSGLLAGWLSLVHAWELPLVWFTALILLGIVVASVWRTRDWLNERNSGWSRLGTGFLAWIPLAILTSLLPMLRMAQVDVRHVATPYDGAWTSYETSRWAAADSRREPPVERLQQIRDAILASDVIQEHRDLNQLRDTPTEAELAAAAAARTRAIEKLRELSDNTYAFRDPGLKRFLQETAEAAMKSGDLPLALDAILTQLRLVAAETRAYLREWPRVGDWPDPAPARELLLRWAEHPQQTADTIRKALVALDDVYPTSLEQWQAVHQRGRFVPVHPLEWLPQVELQEVLRSSSGSATAAMSHRSIRQELTLASANLPWERERSGQILEQVSTYQRSVLAAFYRGLLAQQEAQEKEAQDLADKLRYVLAGTVDDDTTEVDSETIFQRRFQGLRSSFLLKSELVAAGPLHQRLIITANHLVDQLALKTQLALIAFRLDHGKYPSTLAELVPDELTALPVDPFTGRGFEYRPNGLKYPVCDGWVADGYLHDDLQDNVLVPPGTPFFWARGPRNLRLVLDWFKERLDEEDSSDATRRQELEAFLPPDARLEGGIIAFKFNSFVPGSSGLQEGYGWPLKPRVFVLPLR